MSTTPINPVKRGYRRYLFEFTVAMAFYMAVVCIRGWLLRGPILTSPVLWMRLTVALLPIIPVALIVVAIVRCLRSMDEMMRRIQTESLAIAGVVTALLAVTYGFLEGPGFPFLSAWWTYVAFMGTWLVMSILLRWRYH